MSDGVSSNDAQLMDGEPRSDTGEVVAYRRAERRFAMMRRTDTVEFSQLEVMALDSLRRGVPFTDGSLRQCR
jgi:hypothetical protein